MKLLGLRRKKTEQASPPPPPKPKARVTIFNHICQGETEPTVRVVFETEGINHQGHSWGISPYGIGNWPKPTAEESRLRGVYLCGLPVNYEGLGHPSYMPRCGYDHTLFITEHDPMTRDGVHFSAPYGGTIIIEAL